MRGHAVCEMELADVHRNAMGNVMGGAIFTLADFALAICCNIGEETHRVGGLEHQLLPRDEGTKLTATATCDKPAAIWASTPSSWKTTWARPSPR